MQNDSICAIIKHEAMVIVLDTNVVVSAVLGPGGASREVLRTCLNGQHVPLMGTALFLEYESLMKRDKLFKECLLSRQEREDLFDAFLSVCRWQTIYFAWRPNLPDEADNHIIELAVAGGASAIVTKNKKDFTRAELRFPSIRVLSPYEFITIDER